MLEGGDSSGNTRTKLRWQVPARYSLGTDICGKRVGKPAAERWFTCGRRRGRGKRNGQ